MDPTTFDTLVRRLSSAPSRRRLLRALAGGGLGALVTALGREPARERVCTGFPCKNNIGRCTAAGSTCCCCRLPGYHRCLDRRQCRGSGGTCVLAPVACAPGADICQQG